MATNDGGTMIAKLRQDAGLGTRELARRANVSPTFISRIESGKEASVSPETLMRICKSVDAPQTELFVAFRVVHPDITKAFFDEPILMLEYARKHKRG